jgi:type I restriction enzyme S subunit
MPTYQDRRSSGVASLGEIPNHWPVTALKRVLSEPLKYGATEPGDESDPNSPRYLRITDFDGDGSLREDTFVSLPEEIARHYYLRDGDVLFARSGATVGKTFLFRNYSGRACFAGYLIKASTARHKLTPEFLTYFTRSPAYDAWKDSIFTQATIQNIGADKYARLPICLPPLPEQQRIAAYLDASCAVLDAAVAAKRRQLETLDALRKSIIQRAVTRGISESVTLKSTGNAWMEQIPQGWKLVCLKRIAAIQGGLTLGKPYEGPLIERPYLRVGNVQDGHLDLAEVSVIELPASVAKGVELRPDDVLMTEGGDLDKLGRGYLWKGEIPECLHQNHIFAVRCFLHKLKPRFLAYVTAAKYGRDYFEATGKKTTNLACTNATKVGEFPIPLPRLTEQEAICAYLEKKLGEVKNIVTGIEAQIATLTAYRKSLIHECVTGQRRISEADVRQAEQGGGQFVPPLALGLGMNGGTQRGGIHHE